MNAPATLRAPAVCQGVSDLLGQPGDKWTMQVVVAVRDRPGVSTT